jgi:hypothetical protein
MGITITLTKTIIWNILMVISDSKIKERGNLMKNSQCKRELIENIISFLEQSELSHKKVEIFKLIQLKDRLINSIAQVLVMAPST